MERMRRRKYEWKGMEENLDKMRLSGKEKRYTKC